MQACKISAPIKRVMGKKKQRHKSHTFYPRLEVRGDKRGEGKMDAAVRSTWNRGRAVPLSAVP